MSEPGTSAGSAGAASAVFAGWMEERLAGGAASFEDMLAAHPEQADELRALREDWEALARLRSSPSFAARLRARVGEDVDPHLHLEPEAPDPTSTEVLGRLAERTGARGRYRLKGELA